MHYNIIPPNNSPAYIDYKKLGECAMIIAAKRHNIKLGINNEPYPQLGKPSNIHYEYFIKQLAQECKKRRLPFPDVTVVKTNLDLSWVDESPETLRFVKAAFRNPESLASKLHLVETEENGIKELIPMPREFKSYTYLLEFKRSRRQFIQIEGLKSNLAHIAANLVSLTLSPSGVSSIANHIGIAFQKKKHDDIIIKALGARTPMSMVIEWCKKHNINKTIINHIEKTLKLNKIFLSNSIKEYCISVIYKGHSSDFKDTADIAKKIRNYYHNSKKTLDGRKLAENKPIKILLKAEVLKKLEKHRISTEISRTEFIENLINKHFDELAIKEAEARATNQRNKNAPSSNSTNPEPRNSFGVGSNNFTNNSATTMNNSHQTLPINNMPNYAPIFPPETNNNKSIDNLSPQSRAEKILRGDY